MEGIFRILFVLSISAYVVQAASYFYGSTKIGDVTIQTLNNGSLFCDSMVCPPETKSCRVTKKNDPNNAELIVKESRCLGAEGVVLAETKTNQANPYHNNVNLQIETGAGINSIQGGTVRQLTPEEQRELEENLRLTEQRVQQQISAAMNRIQKELAPFQDGSFAENLKNRIKSSFSNAFY